MIGLAFLFLRAKLGQAFAWITASAARILATCLALSLAFGLYERSQADKWHSEAIKHLDALRLAEVAKQAAEAKSQTLAKDNTDEHETRLAGDLDAARRYIAAHRVQQCAAPGSGGEGVNPGVPVAAPAVPVLVSVPDSDIDACTRNYDQALGAADYLNGLIGAGLGVVVK
jgi:hypothetical protein